MSAHGTKLMDYGICQLNATPEWLNSESIDYIVECLEYCHNPEMLADLRGIFPRQALRSASIKLSPTQREYIKLWLQQLNGEMAA
ncbi:hypothetical protein [Nostoc sp. MS1]|uniref:hypothetical protein n=1 Tax=Nostoc sp. MS1 TaxID=2764711 RepID=UPI001CC5EDCA|nr:hypothetical protein [Nostoc sp. MS1]BCL40260.1 hypothetical protein NSMS1_67070 [Nostoc sp. MS1]